MMKMKLTMNLTYRWKWTMVETEGHMTEKYASETAYQSNVMWQIGSQLSVWCLQFL